MDLNAFAFHSAEPGHLTLGKLMDGSGQLNTKLVIGDFAKDILSDELVFQTIIFQP